MLGGPSFRTARKVSPNCSSFHMRIITADLCKSVNGVSRAKLTAPKQRSRSQRLSHKLVMPLGLLAVREVGLIVPAMEEAQNGAHLSLR